MEAQQGLVTVNFTSYVRTSPGPAGGSLWDSNSPVIICGLGYLSFLSYRNLEISQLSSTFPGLLPLAKHSDGNTPSTTTTTTMSSLRNSIQRRSHRERGQLKEREKLGLLEKHKVQRDHLSCTSAATCADSLIRTTNSEQKTTRRSRPSSKA